MKAYRKLTGIAAVFMALLILAANILALNSSAGFSKSYRVEISRAAGDIQEYGLSQLDLSKYPSLVNVTAGEGSAFLKGGNKEYAIREIDGTLYRFDYETSGQLQKMQLCILNLSLLSAALLIFIILYILERQIIKPFETIKNLPEELARGNLTVPVRQQKNRCFGNFLWGIDLLREKLEKQKAAELKAQKEKKSLVLSLTHDIKTPLSAIKLYSQALEKNLYQEPEKQLEAAEKISRKVDEIEDYIEKITQSSREDFLHLEVQNGEFYLKEIEKAITDYYEDKLKLLKIPYTMDFGEDCLLKGDRDRCVEILQNLMENAIKYGGGGKISIVPSEETECRILTVRNDCCSLNTDELPHIFESFWRGSNSDKVSGSGLGLYICRSLASKMGGEIFAEISNGHLDVSLVISKA
ncbi:MAG: sensor histidine kinase [Candidatus Limivicinus sp.]|jgi:signal transduction histidine kinase